MENMKYKLIIGILLIIIISMGVYIYGVQKDLTLQDYFHSGEEYSSEWDNVTGEITVEKVFPLKFNQTYENVSTEVSFFKDSTPLKEMDVVNDTHDGKLIVYVKLKLPEEPNRIEFNIHDAVLIDSDVEGLNYSRNFHLW